MAARHRRLHVIGQDRCPHATPPSGRDRQAAGHARPSRHGHPDPGRVRRESQQGSLPEPTDPDGGSWQILAVARESDADLIGIDEAEFFVPEIVDVVEALRSSGRHVIVTGLNLDFAGRPFGPMPDLMARADEVTTLTAICVICGDTATRTQRLVNGRPAAIDDPLVVIGGMDDRAIETYEARCLRHHEVGPAQGHPR